MQIIFKVSNIFAQNWFLIMIIEMRLFNFHLEIMIIIKLMSLLNHS